MPKPDNTISLDGLLAAAEQREMTDLERLGVGGVPNALENLAITDPKKVEAIVQAAGNFMFKKVAGELHPDVAKDRSSDQASHDFHTVQSSAKRLSQDAAGAIRQHELFAGEEERESNLGPVHELIATVKNLRAQKAELLYQTPYERLFPKNNRAVTVQVEAFNSSNLVAFVTGLNRNEDDPVDDIELAKLTIDHKVDLAIEGDTVVVGDVSISVHHNDEGVSIDSSSPDNNSIRSLNHARNDLKKYRNNVDKHDTAHADKTHAVGKIDETRDEYIIEQFDDLRSVGAEFFKHMTEHPEYSETILRMLDAMKANHGHITIEDVRSLVKSGFQEDVNLLDQLYDRKDIDVLTSWLETIQTLSHDARGEFDDIDQVKDKIIEANEVATTLEPLNEAKRLVESLDGVDEAVLAAIDVQLTKFEERYMESSGTQSLEVLDLIGERYMDKLKELITTKLQQTFKRSRIIGSVTYADERFANLIDEGMWLGAGDKALSPLSDVNANVETGYPMIDSVGTQILRVEPNKAGYPFTNTRLLLAKKHARKTGIEIGALGVFYSRPV